MTIDRTAGRSIFGGDAQGYADARPGYPTEVFDILRKSCGLKADMPIFEVGAGTGQATAPLIELGCSVAAIEPDQRLAAVLAERLLPDAGDRLDIHIATFETVELPHASYDLGIAATSLHWLDQAEALGKARRLLRRGAHWAMWWTIFGDPAHEDAFQKRTQKLFDGLEFSPSHTGGIPFGLDVRARCSDLVAAGFNEIAYEAIRWSPVLSTAQLLGLTATFSPVARLTDYDRAKFLADIGRIADDEFSGFVQRNFVTSIYTARSP